MKQTELIHFDPSRREFLSDLLMTSLSLVSVPLFLGGCESFFEKIKNRPVRRCIRDHADVNQQLDIYKAAVSAMRSLTASDPRFWTNQASIHQNFCPHGNWFFFPWHRVYLFYFESICRELTQEKSFALPYWDWCVEQRIPAAFWGSGNSLFNATRAATPTSSASLSSVGLPLLNGYCDEPDFNLFAGGSATSLRPGGPRVYGNVEGTPHNYIHGSFVGGDMGTFMSPLDPIFWSHHCMVDLCWFEWNITRGHANTNDSTWLNFDHAGMFVDDAGNPASMTTLASLLLPLLSYRYETGIDCVAAPDLQSIAQENRAAFDRTKSIIQKGAPIRMNIKQRFNLTEEAIEISAKRNGVASFKTDASAFSRVFANEKEERVILVLKRVSEPVDSDLFLRVYINKNDAGAQTPVEDPHYAGSFYFFRHSHDAAVEEVDFTVDITSTLRKLQSAGELGDLSNLSLNLVGVPVEGKDAGNTSISMASAECLIASVSVEKMQIE